MIVFRYSLYMRCQKQPLFKIKEPIANVWEAQIDLELWQRIVKVKKLLKVTYSSVVRFCVFRMIDSRIDFESIAMDIHSCCKPGRRNSHRLQLCLYGNDEKRLRILALKIGVPVVQFIRIAILKYLHILEKIRKINYKKNEPQKVRKFIKQVLHIKDSVFSNRSQERWHNFIMSYYGSLD